MFEVFIENFCKEKQAAWLEGCVEVYMAQYAKKAENDYPKEAVMRIAKATFEKGIDIQDVIEFSELPEDFFLIKVFGNNRMSILFVLQSHRSLTT